MMQSLKRFLTKKWVIGLGVVAVGGISFYALKAHGATQPIQYVLAQASRGTVVTSVSGSGQVSGEQQLDIKPTVSATVTKVLAQSGQTVKAGDPLIQLDATDQMKAVRDAAQSVTDAQISLAASELSLAKLKEPVDPVQLLQAQDAVSQAQGALQKLQQGPDANDLATAQSQLVTAQNSAKMSADGTTPQVVRDAYDSAVSTLKGTTQTLQQSLYDADSVLGIDNTLANASYVNLYSVLDTSKKLNADNEYPAAKVAVANAKALTDALADTGEDPAKITAALTATQEAVGLVGPLLQSTYDGLLDTLTSSSFSQSSLSSLENLIQGDHSNVSSKQASLLNITQSISQAESSYQDALQNVARAQSSLAKLTEPANALDVAAAQQKVAEAQKALDKLKQGADPIDVQISENSVQSRQSALTAAQNKLSDAQQALSNYTITAPFDGMVAKVDVQTSDAASNGTVVATLLTHSKIADVTLNEVDAAKVKVGQKATLTFDAIPNLTIAGTVSEVDQLGTVSQGVVSYSIKIAFDTQDDRIKPDMSVSASIVTDVHQDVIVVPNAAVKALGSNSIVQTLPVSAQDAQTAATTGITSDAGPTTAPVQVGLANDSETEITSGVNEGDWVVVRTVNPSTTTNASSASANSGIRIQGLGGGLGGGSFGGGGFGGGTVRTGGGGGGGRTGG